MRNGQSALCVEAQIEACVEAWIRPHCAHHRTPLCFEAWTGAHCVPKHR